MDLEAGAAGAVDQAVGAIVGAGKGDNGKFDGGEAFGGVGLTGGVSELEDVFGGPGDEVAFEERDDAERRGFSSTGRRHVLNQFTRARR